MKTMRWTAYFLGLSPWPAALCRPFSDFHPGRRQCHDYRIPQPDLPVLLSVGHGPGRTPKQVRRPDFSAVFFQRD